MSDYAYPLVNLARTTGPERHWFEGEVMPSEASEVRRQINCFDEPSWR